MFTFIYILLISILEATECVMIDSNRDCETSLECSKKFRFGL